MFSRWTTLRGTSSLTFLVRHAYRSLHFYDAAATSSAILALGELHEPPLNAHALVLSVLTVLPGFVCGSHVAQLFNGLSQLSIGHSMLTAHLLKRYIRCCFGNVGPVVVAGGSQGNGNCMETTLLGFILSFATVLRTINEYHELHSPRITVALLDSVEESLGAGHILTSACYHNPDEDNNNHPNNNDVMAKVEAQRSKDSVGEDVSFVMRILLLESHRCKAPFTHLERLLAPLAVHLHFQHILSLMLLMKKLSGNPMPWMACIEKKEKMGVLQLHLLECFSYLDNSVSLPLFTVSKGEIIAFLWQVNHYDFGELASDAERRIHHLANVFCCALEKVPFSLETIWQLTVNDLVICNEIEQLRLNKLVGTSGWRVLPLLEPVLDALHLAVEKRFAPFASGGDKWRAAEAALVVCYRYLYYLVNVNRIYSHIFDRVCKLTCAALDNLSLGADEFDPDVVLHMFAVIEAVKLKLLQLLQDATFLQMDLLSLLIEALAKYEDKTLSTFGRTKTVDDRDVEYLYNVLHGQQQHQCWLKVRPRTGMRGELIEEVLKKIGRRTTVSCNTTSLLTKLLGILASRDFVSLYRGDNAPFMTLADSVRLSRGVDLLRGTLRSSEWGIEGAHSAFRALVELLLVLSPLMWRCDVGRCWGLIPVARIPESCGVLGLIYGLLQDCILWVSRALPSNREWNGYSLPLLDASVVAERYALRSRSSKLWKMMESCLDERWCKGEESSEDSNVSLYSSCLVERRTSTVVSAVVELALWISAFRFGVAVGNTGSCLARSLINVSYLREINTKALEIASYLLLSYESEVSVARRQRLLRAFHLDSLCETMLQPSSIEPIFVRHPAFVRVVPLLVVEVYRVVIWAAVSEEGSYSAAEQVRLRDDVFPPSHTDDGSSYAFCMDAEELLSFLRQFEDEFQASEGHIRSLSMLHEIVFESLTCIASLSSSLKDWIERFRNSRSFRARDIWVDNVCHLNHDDSDPVVLANTRNTLLWSLILLALFLRRRRVAQDSNRGAVQLVAAQRAVARLVQLVSRYTPILRRRRPAPETLLAVSLCEAMEAAGAFAGPSDFLLVVFAEVLRREEEQLPFWENVFGGVATRVRRYLRPGDVPQKEE